MAREGLPATARHLNLPRGKRIVLYRSGDKFYPGAPFTVNPRYIKSVNDLLADATEKVDAVWGAVRSIHTPNTGTKVNTLEAINPQGSYVAAGVKGFIHIPGGYENIGKPVLIRKRRTGPSRNASRRSYYGEGVFRGFKVAVYRNGDNTTTYPFTFTTDDYDDWDKALDRLSKNLPNGPIKRFFYLSGNPVQGPEDLINYGTYVVAGRDEDFHKAQYVDVTLGVEDDGSTTFFGDPRSRWSQASPGTVDSGGRLSQNHSSPSISASQGSERGGIEEEDEEEEDEDDAEYSYYENYRHIEEEEEEEEKRRERGSEWSGGTGEEEEDSGGGGRWRREGGFDQGSEVMILGDSAEDHDLRVYGDTAFPMQSPIVEESEGEQEEDEEDGEEMEEEVEDWRSEEGGRVKSRLSVFDSGHASLLSDEDRPDSVFRAKRLSRPATRAIEVDYDTDDGGVYKAKRHYDYAAQEVLESSATNIELPVDLLDAAEVQEDIYAA
ncbi:doublecortin domain-containing protein 2-like [Eriocheir sinensis]|uniref:doublecortin domain-containing protein 2-like n=1 Tax=Eriocheir sinensis TaxID=95602 RepID=UPI0021CAA24D|nr:doublecortin domain-containing protein 2-like [Eriocheir sinensis]